MHNACTCSLTNFEAICVIRSHILDSNMYQDTSSPRTRGDRVVHWSRDLSAWCGSAKVPTHSFHHHFQSLAKCRINKMIKKNRPKRNAESQKTLFQSDPAAQNIAADDACHRMSLQTSVRREAAWAVTLARCEKVNKRSRSAGENAMF